MGREQRRYERRPQSLWPVAIVVVVVVLVAVQLGSPFRDAADANDSVIKKAQHDNRSEPWMKHVTDWSAGPRTITVTTDYPPDRKSSWLSTYEICLAVKRAYAKHANELPRVVVKGADARIKIRVDGSKHRDAKSVPLATSTKGHDFICGITPPNDYRKAARKLDIPVYLY